jgi:hypothetical protein
MNTALERVRTKISELEARLADLRIAERELLALELPPRAKPARATPPAHPAETKAGRAATRRQPTAARATPKRQSIAATVIETLSRLGSLPVPEIAKEIKGKGRKISSRSISYALKDLKKRGRVANEGSQWTLTQMPSLSAEPFESANM